MRRGKAVKETEAGRGTAQGEDGEALAWLFNTPEAKMLRELVRTRKRMGEIATMVAQARAQACKLAVILSGSHEATGTAEQLAPGVIDWVNARFEPHEATEAAEQIAKSIEAIERLARGGEDGAQAPSKEPETRTRHKTGGRVKPA